MKTLVLDATELRRDWLLGGLVARLLGYATFHTILNVCIPASVIEEVIAHHTRAVAEAVGRSGKLRREWRSLGLGELVAEPPPFDFRAHLVERFDEVLSFSVLPLPTVSHEELVMRATSRTPPFDEKGSGYRDSLVWASVVELAKSGASVVLVSADGIFRGKDGQLAPSLRDELGSLSGSVELVTELAPWLLEYLPWRAKNLSDAIAQAQDREFFDFLLQSDIQTSIEPEAEDIGFDRAPYTLAVTEVEWTGDSHRVGTRSGKDGLLLVEYDVGETVSFEAELPEHARREEGWEVRWRGSGRLKVDGSVNLVARMAVIFDNELGMSVEDLSWRRGDGTGPGLGLVDSALDTPLF